jgi:[acyl-carrier-protein] S-malonyltransferase
MTTFDARTVVLFPGQGSQTADMREHVARHCPGLLERCLERVGEDPFTRVSESTRFQQPAIFCASWAGWTALGLTPAAAAGHSLGELAALAAAGVLTVEDALDLVVLRGRLMAEADPDGSMVALVGASDEDAAAIARDAGVTIANDNAPGQIVLSGPRERLAGVEADAGRRSVRAVALPVAGAFHSPSMQPAVGAFRAALDEVELREPRFPVYSCAAARPFEDVRAELAAALVRPVRWRETFAALHDAGWRSFVEAGPGRVLAGLGRRIVPGTKVAAVEALAADA